MTIRLETDKEGPTGRRYTVYIKSRGRKIKELNMLGFDTSSVAYRAVSIHPDATEVDVVTTYKVVPKIKDGNASYALNPRRKSRYRVRKNSKRYGKRKIYSRRRKYGKRRW